MGRFCAATVVYFYSGLWWIIAPAFSDVELGESVLVAGFPYGELYSNTIKVTKGIVSANRGLGDDTGQFQIDAAVQPGNSGGPIYDENGSIVGVVISRLNKMKVR